MTVFTEGRHAAEFVLNEGDKNFSRDNLKIAASQTIVPGSVLGKRAVVADVVATPSADAGNTASSGTIAMDAAAVTSKAKDGRYAGVASAATKVDWADPDGNPIGVSTHGTLFNKGGIRFTITAGGTPNVVGDTFYVDVAADVADFEYGSHDPAATDGFEIAAALALYPATTGVGETVKISGITRHSEVNGKTLTWKAAIAAVDLANGIQALAARGIIVR
ncbi:head decoration protein [Mesorhizobium sp.]|uniref:head decoration protein n=1 Tax=Mesorhizobium sp. TaxID=1871066 RepID=UPI00257F733A|nr:head decoration protein [Mesorhizobium sp.]